MKLVKDDQELLISEIQEDKVYKGWHLHFTCEECGKNVIAKDWYRYKNKIETGKYLCPLCTSKRTNKEKYGCEYVNQDEKIKQKRKETFLKNYGFDHPQKNEKVKEKTKQTNIKKYGYDNPQKNKEIQKKTKQTNLLKYGHENVFQNEEIKQKIKVKNLKTLGCENPQQNKEIQEKTQETNLRRHGHRFVLQNEEIKQKAKETSLRKWGVEYALQNEKVRDKIKQTNLLKYGFDNPQKNSEVRKKTIKTNLKRYNSEYPAQNKEIQEKTKQTNLKDYDVEYILQNKEINQKLKKNNLIKYGVENVFQNEEIKNIIKQKKLEKHFFSLYNKFTDLTPLFSVEDYKGVDKKYSWRCRCGNAFLDHLNNGHKPRCLKCYPRRIGTSQYEEQIVTFLEELGIDNIISNSRQIIAPHELDIYLPDYNLAIEFNGLYWHSSEYVDKFYHLDKTKKCLGKGITLIHIFEDEWIEKNDIVKSIIKSRLGISDKIYARKCIIKEVSIKDVYKFLELNHIQGSISSSINYGLYFNDELMSLLSNGKSRFNKNYGYEVYRFCNKINVSVVGGFSKLLKHFQKEHKGSIITYADKRYFTGDIYRNNGFEELEPSKPNYFYIKGEKRYGRLNFQKHKLEDKLDEFYEELTEAENMIINGYNKIYDCGNHVFAKEIS